MSYGLFLNFGPYDKRSFLAKWLIWQTAFSCNLAHMANDSFLHFLALWLIWHTTFCFALLLIIVNGLSTCNMDHMANGIFRHCESYSKWLVSAFHHMANDHLLHCGSYVKRPFLAPWIIRQRTRHQCLVVLEVCASESVAVAYVLGCL